MLGEGYSVVGYQPRPACLGMAWVTAFSPRHSVFSVARIERSELPIFGYSGLGRVVSLLPPVPSLGASTAGPGHQRCYAVLSCSVVSDSF